MDFLVNDLVMPILDSLSFEQTYDSIGGGSPIRMADGSLVYMENWRKISTTLNGGGWVPSGLSGVDFSVPVNLKCAGPRVVTSISNAIVIPANRRGDIAPVGFAVVNNEQVTTDISVTDNLATLVEVVGAASYQVQYVPELVVSATFSETGELADADYSWSLTCEEI